MSLDSAPARPMRVLFAVSEYYPLAKTGGLGDVTGALPRAQRELGVDARVVMPAYRSILHSAVHLRMVRSLEVLPGRKVRLAEATVADSSVPVYLVICPELYDRPGGPYVDESGSDWPDNAERFAVFAHAAALLALGRAGFGWQPDVVHAHDWQAGLVPLLMHFAGSGQRPASIFTIHNAAFAGRCSFDTAKGFGLPSQALGVEGAEFYGDISFLKAGIYYADKLTTVSPTHARELCTPELGCGFDGLLRARAADFVGILNGIDDTLWNPATDRHLPHNYSAPDCGGKQACKAALQRELGLPEAPRSPLAIFGSRLTEQKMADLLLGRLGEALSAAPDLQVALVAQGDRALEQGFRDIAQAHPNRIAMRQYSEPLAHRLHAGGDLLLHGSRFEPCGLVQMYSMRYGTVPLVRKTGGLADSVNDADSASPRPTGFVFDRASGDAMLAGLMRGVTVYRHAPGLWRKLQRNGMRRDYGWRRSAKRHLELYSQLAERRPQ